MSPILSARARRATPHPEKGAFAAKLPRSNKQLLQHCGVGKLQEIVPEETVVNAEEILYVNAHICGQYETHFTTSSGNKLPMDAETHQGVLKLLKTIPSLANTARPSDTHHFDEFLRSSSPPLDLPELEVLPIFPRSAPLGPRSDGASVALDVMAQVSERLITKVRMRDEDEDDLAEEHLVAVDGWRAYLYGLWGAYAYFDHHF